MSSSPNVSLRLSNAPESVALVQQALRAVAVAVGLDALEANDLDTAVTEVCNNVVLHAYDGQRGPLELEVFALTGALEVVVRDRGIGIRPHVGERRQPHTGLGMPIVHALTQHLAFSKLAGGGTEVRMRFTTPDVAALEPLADDEPEGETDPADEREGAIAIAVAPCSLAHALLPGILSSLAKQALFSTEAIAGLQLLAHALTASAHDRSDAGRLRVSVGLAPGELELRVGALPAGTPARLFAAMADAAGGRLAIERLPQLGAQATRDVGETLALRMHEPR
jgi:anti-sigma regulatory factor (Ser/Thr protein kinase)